MSLEKENASRTDYEKKMISILSRLIDILESLKKDYLSVLK